MPLLDAWTNVFSSPGTRTTGSGKGDFAVLGPRWRGTLPTGVRALYNARQAFFVCTGPARGSSTAPGRSPLWRGFR